MLAPLATLVFLSALLLTAAVITEIFARMNARIASALRGQTPAVIGTSLVIRLRPTRAQLAPRQPMRAHPQLHAAA